MKITSELSIITVNYGGSKEVLNLWKSIQACAQDIDYEFIVVDNASPNQDVKNLEKGFKNTNVHLIVLNQNLGFGGGYSEGIKFANGKFIAIVNPDITLTKSSLKPLLATLKSEKNAGLVAPKLLNSDGSTQQTARHFPTLWIMFGRRLAIGFDGAYDSEKQWYQNKKIQAVDWVQGSFMGLKKEIFVDQLHGFDPRFFLFLEDTDLCRRLWKQKLRVLFVPEAVAFHGENRLSGGNLWKAWRKKTFWIHISSALKYFWKYRNESLPEVK